MPAFAGRTGVRKLDRGLGNKIIARERSAGSPTGEIVETERLGGLLRSYQRAAA